MRCDSWASLLAYNLASPYLGHEPKARVATKMKSSNQPQSFSLQNNWRFYSKLIGLISLN
jgi:hypothetical protein